MTIWRPGMAAVCIYRAWVQLTPSGPGAPAFRQIVRVTAVETYGRFVFLALHGFPANNFYHADGFRPLVDGGSESDIVARIKNCRPAREEVPAWA